MAEANPPRENRVSLSTSSDATADASQSQNKRYTFSTGSDAMLEDPQVRDKRVSLSTGSDAMTDDPQSRDRRHTMSTGSDVITDLTERCKIHKDEVVNYYCPSHKATGCGVCMTSTHNKCKGKFYVPDKVKNIGSSKEFKDFKELIRKLTMKSDNLSKSLDTDIEASAHYLNNALREIEVFREEMNEALDTCKASLVEKMEEISARDKTNNSSAADQTRYVQAELQHMSTDIQTLLRQNQHCQAFIEMKNAETKLADFKQQLDEAGNVNVSAFCFKPSEDLQNLVRRQDALGKVVDKNIAKVGTEHVTDIQIQTKGNKETCWVSGSAVLSKNRLVIADLENKTVKLIDTERQRVISEYSPESTPWDVTRVNARQVAVTLPDARKILLMTSGDTLKPDREIGFNHRCIYIAYTDEQFVVGCGDHAVRILRMTGELIRTINTSITGEQLFRWAPRVTVGPLYKAIYTVDQLAERVLKLSMDGMVAAQYNDARLDTPTYTAVDELGRVYVCGYKSHTIHVLTPGCSKGKILLTTRDGVCFPRSVSYCPDTQRLYVGTKEIHIYQLS